MLQCLRLANRAISEVVSSLVMLLIVSLAGAALYSFSMGTFSSSWSSFVLQTMEEEEYTKERFEIISVWWDNGSLLNLTVFNYGKIELAIDAIYFDGKKITINEGGGVIIIRGAIIHVKCTSPVPIVSNETYQIVAVSIRGTRDEMHWKT